MDSTCGCGFQNSASAKFCGGCGRSIAKPVPASTICTGCGHESPAGARFCENCAAPLGAANANVNGPPPLSAPTAASPVTGRDPVRKAKPEKVGKYHRVTGVFTSTTGQTFRILPHGASDRPIDLSLGSLRLGTRLAQLVKPGDELGVIGSYNPDGTMRPEIIVNLRTNVMIRKPTYSWRLFFILILLGPLLMLTLGQIGSRDPGPLFVVILIGVALVLTISIFLQRRRFSRLL